MMNNSNKKLHLPNGLWNTGKLCVEKIKSLLKLMDSTTSLLIRSSKRWSMAAAITVGIDETDTILTDEDTLAGSTSTLNGSKFPRKSRHLYHHWHRSVSDLRNVAKILSMVSSRCEASIHCSLCTDYNVNVGAVDAIPCILVTALQTYHRLTVDVAHFLASAGNQTMSPRSATFTNLRDLEQEVTIISGSKQYTTNSTSVFASSGCTQPYRFGGRVGLFGHYLRSLKIMLLLTCIKLDAQEGSHGGRWGGSRTVDGILKGICALASSIEAVERMYVKKGQRLLFCGPDLMALGPKCSELQQAFEALSDTENAAACWFACFQENMSVLTGMIQRFEARQVQILLQFKLSAAFQASAKRVAEHKFFCEDIEPVSLNWSKVDDAMLSSGATTSDDDGSFDDPYDGCDPHEEEAVTTLIRASKSSLT